MLFGNEKAGAAAKSPLRRLLQFLHGLLHLDRSRGRRSRPRRRRRRQREAVRELPCVFRDEQPGEKEKRRRDKDGEPVVVGAHPGHKVDRALRRSMLCRFAAISTIARSRNGGTQSTSIIIFKTRT